MQDRTSVKLIVLTTQASAAEALFDWESSGGDSEPDLTSFDFEDVNYGTLRFLTKLQDAGIAFDSNWGSGSEYGPGTHYGRFTSEGEFDSWEISDSSINPNIDELVTLLKHPKKLREFILEHVEKTTPLPWDNQEEYGKLYRTKQLINPE